jgi:hypothetical protein
VISVNPEDECEKVAAQHAGISIIPARRDGRAEFGRPLVYMTDLLDAAGSAPTGSVALVNADVLFQGGRRTLERVAEIAGREFLFAHRYEVPTPSAETGWLYRRGFDFFAFPTRRSRDFDMSGFTMGVPWWDYWLPFAALAAGLPIGKLETNSFRHLTHTTKWDQAHWVAGLRSITGKLSAYVAEAAESEDPERSIPASFMRFALTSMHPDAVPAHGMGQARGALGVGLGIFLVDELARRARIHRLDADTAAEKSL